MAAVSMAAVFMAAAPVAAVTSLAAPRFVASLDGNGWATRFTPLLASSSVVFKQTSPWFEFFYTAVRAGALSSHDHQTTS